MIASEKKAWARLATLRISEGLIALSLGFLICVLFRKTHTMQQFSCAFWQRHSRIADTCEVYFTSLGIVALWAVAKACLLGKHWNCACYSDIAQSTHWSERYKAKSLSKSYVVWRRAQSFLFRMQIKVSEQKTSISLITQSAKFHNSADNKKLSSPLHGPWIVTLRSDISG